jgi:hypothetical protein
MLRGQLAQPQEHGEGHVPLRGIPARRLRQDIVVSRALSAQVVSEKFSDLSGCFSIAMIQRRTHAGKVAHCG